PLFGPIFPGASSVKREKSLAPSVLLYRWCSGQPLCDWKSVTCGCLDFGRQGAQHGRFIGNRSVFTNMRATRGGRRVNAMRAKPARVTEIAAETIDARLLLKVLSDFKKGDFTTRLPSEQTGLTGKIYDALNEVIDINERMAKEFDRVATVVGKEGRIRQRASLPMAIG